MEINYGSVKITTVKQSRLMCAGGETALAASLVIALVKAQLVVSILFQECTLKLLTNVQPKSRGDSHISCPSTPQDVDDNNADANDDGKTNDDENGPNGVEENGDEEDEDEQASGEDPNEEDDNENEDEDDDEDGDEDGDDDEEEEDDEDEEEEDEEEESLQPPKKRKK